MPLTTEEDSLWLLESSFPFPFHTVALTISRPIGRVTSSVVRSLDERNRFVVDGPADLVLYLGWCRTASHQWSHLKESMRTWCSWGIGSTMEQRGISELVGSERSLWNQSVQKIIPRLQVGTSIVRYDVECRRVKKRVDIGWNVCEMSSNHEGIYKVGMKFKFL
jgi:hypothetical protein